DIKFYDPFIQKPRYFQRVHILFLATVVWRSNTPSHSFILLGVGGTWAVFDNFGGFLMSYSFV
uniref:Uncharacterized protein n=1 Tax=Oncorhynchus kisutch TaxID=8019 RepID=A0A8C7GIB6_ONCKI